jgi:hypothetical protein
MSRSMHRSLAPIRIRAGALGRECPNADLWVAPGNRVLISGFATRLLFGCDAAFVRAQALIGPVADQPSGAASVTYHHIRCERPCTIVANGVPTQTETDGGVGLRTLTGIQKTGASRPKPGGAGKWTLKGQGRSNTPPVLTPIQGRVAALVTAALA